MLSHRLQNVIYLCLMTDDKQQSFAFESKYPKGAFLDEDQPYQGGYTLEHRNDPLLENFRVYCVENGIDIVLLFADNEDIVEKKYTLLSNTLKICQAFLRKIARYQLSLKPTLGIQESTFDPHKIMCLIQGLHNETDLGQNII